MGLRDPAITYVEALDDITVSMIILDWEYYEQEGTIPVDGELDVRSTELYHQQTGKTLAIGEQDKELERWTKKLVRECYARHCHRFQDLWWNQKWNSL